MHPVASSFARARWSAAAGRLARCSRAAASTPAVDGSSTTRRAASSSPTPADSTLAAWLEAQVAAAPTPDPVSSSSAAPASPSTPSSQPTAADAPPSDAAAAVSASAHLFAVAASEAADPSPPSRSAAADAVLRSLNDAPWTGDEPIEAAVLRMLVDKHKPHRSGVVRSADDRIRDEVQRSALERMMDAERGLDSQGSGGARVAGGGGDAEAEADVRAAEGRLATTRPGGIKRNSKVFPGHLVGGDPDHQPWMSEYAMPTASESPLVRRGVLLAAASCSAKQRALDPAARAKARRERALEAGPGRALTARGRALDFQLGKIAARVGGPSAAAEADAFDKIDEDLDVRVVMTPADYRIERARRDGAFDNLPGRGKPLAHAGNSHIGRSEFFMNRVMQKNKVLPVWIQLQKEHASALASLRTALEGMLHRRLLIHPALPKFATVGQIERLRVAEVEVGGEERAFWEGMLRGVNNKGRSADGVAPPSTRKGTTSLPIELERAYPRAALLVHATLHAPPPPPPPVRNAIDTSKIDWGMDWSWLARFGLWRWWKALRARLGRKT